MTVTGILSLRATKERPTRFRLSNAPAHLPSVPSSSRTESNHQQPEDTESVVTLAVSRSTVDQVANNERQDARYSKVIGDNHDTKSNSLAESSYSSSLPTSPSPVFWKPKFDLCWKIPVLNFHDSASTYVLNADSSLPSPPGIDTHHNTSHLPSQAAALEIKDIFHAPDRPRLRLTRSKNQKELGATATLAEV